VNLRDHRVEQYLNPVDGEYQKRRITGSEETLTVAGTGGITIRVGNFLA
jgi:hypothetical protein